MTDFPKKTVWFLLPSETIFLPKCIFAKLIFVKCTLLTHLLSFASFFFLSFLLKFFLLMLKAKVDVNVDVKVEREG